MRAVHQNESPRPGGLVVNQNATESAAIVGADADLSKIVTTIKAKFAIHGHAVHDAADGGYIVCRWDLSRYCSGVRELQAFLLQIGGAA